MSKNKKPRTKASPKSAKQREREFLHREQTRKAKLTEKLQSLMVRGTRLDAALAHYKENVEGTGFGLCHNIAVGIVLDLKDRNDATGCEWCQSSVDDGVEHSWVEFDGRYCVDMGDDGRLRIRSVGERPFRVRGKITRRDADETAEWKAARSSDGAENPSTGS